MSPILVSNRPRSYRTSAAALTICGLRKWSTLGRGLTDSLRPRPEKRKLNGDSENYIRAFGSVKRLRRAAYERLAQAEVTGQRCADRFSRPFQGDLAVADQRADAEAVDQSQRAVGYLVRVAAVKLLRRDSRRDLLGKPAAQTRVEVLGEWAQLGVAHG